MRIKVEIEKEERRYASVRPNPLPAALLPRRPFPLFVGPPHGSVSLGAYASTHP